MKTPIDKLNRGQLALALAKALGLSVSYCGGSPLQKGKILSVILGDGNEFEIGWPVCGPLWEREAHNYVEFLYDNQPEKTHYGGKDIHKAIERAFEASKTPESIARAYLTMKCPEGIAW